MKKILLLAVAGFMSLLSTAQISQSIPTRDYLKNNQDMGFQFLVNRNTPAKQGSFKAETHTATFNYLSASTTFAGTTAGNITRALIYPDSAIKTIYSDGLNYPNLFGFGQIMDVSSSYFDTLDRFYYKSSRFTWDSLRFNYQYFRASAPSVVDTLYIDYHFRTYDPKNINRAGQGIFEARYTQSGFRTASVYVDTALNLSYASFDRDTILLTGADSTNSNRIRLIQQKVGRVLYPKTIVSFYATFKPGVKRTRNLNDTLFDFSKKDTLGNSIQTYKQNTFYALYNVESNNDFSADTALNFGMFYTTADKYRNDAANGGRISYIQSYNYKAPTFDRLHISADFTFTATYNSVEDIKRNGGYAVSNLYPNPTNGTVAQIEVTTPKSANAVITISNLMGQKISSQSNPVSTGNTKVNLDINGLTPGVYFYTVNVAGFEATRKFTVSK